MNDALVVNSVEEGRNLEELQPILPLLSSDQLHKRLSHVRSEVMNAISFLSVLLKNPSSVVFYGIGWFVFLLDLYFIYLQWNLRTHVELPFQIQVSIHHLDDLISDLPQAIWILLYLVFYDWSVLGLICAVHSVLRILEDLSRPVKTST